MERCEEKRKRGTETILVVEDDERVRSLIRGVLAEFGYEVLEACDPCEALCVSERHTGPIDLMVTDVVMPHMNGLALADRLALSRSELRVLYMSSDTDNAITHHGVVALGISVLQKPLTSRALLQRVREILETGNPTCSNSSGA